MSQALRINLWKHEAQSIYLCIMQSAVNTERVCIIKQKSLSVTRAISKKTESFSAFPALVERVSRMTAERAGCV